jgi:hypothetical protein
MTHPAFTELEFGSRGRISGAQINLRRVDPESANRFRQLAKQNRLNQDEYLEHLVKLHEVAGVKALKRAKLEKAE